MDHVTLPSTLQWLCTSQQIGWALCMDLKAWLSSSATQTCSYTIYTFLLDHVTMVCVFSADMLGSLRAHLC